MPSQIALSPNLDPVDWEAFRVASRRALDEMVDFLKTVRERPVWQPTPPDVLRQLRRPLPRKPEELEDVLADFASLIRPYATGNLHPLFMGWVHGAGTPVGMVAEMLAAGLNANCGGRNHIALDVERQIAAWAAGLFGFPADASGVFVTGASAANHLALLVARNACLGDEVRRDGLRWAGNQLVAYTSTEAHGCIKQAVEMAGLGSRYLRTIGVDDKGAMRIDLLAAAIAADRTQGLRPFLVVATAGTVNTGGFDDLAAIADLCHAERLWLHIDGSFGALVALAPGRRHLVSGIERADSVGFDFHNWAHVPYEAGFLLVRDPERHRRTFANPAAYLHRAPSGLAAGDVWPCDLGPDLSRGFRALKTWFTLCVHGADRIGACIEHTCELASYLETRLIEQSNLFEMAAPVALNIVCFGLRGSSDGELNEAIVADLQERGVAAPSTTIIDRRPVIRAAIFNHRTTEDDIDTLVAGLRESALRVALRRMRRAEQQKPALRGATS